MASCCDLMASCCDRLCRFRTQQTIKRSLIFSLIVLLVLAAVVLIICFLPINPHVTANIEDARLDTFEFATTQGGGTTTSFFRYNISVALTVRNSNRAAIKHTKPLVATFVFHNLRLHNVTVVDKMHRCRPGKTEVHILHTGGDVPSFLLGAAAAEDFKKQNETGLFKMEVRLSGEITYDGIAIAKKNKLNMSCPLRLQLAPPGPEVVVFQEVNCKPDKQDKIYF